MTFSITILGSGSAVADVNKHHSAHVLNVHEQFYLVDCGEATQLQLRRYGINALKINHIFISHLHGDHVYGLFPLISTMGFMGKKTPLHVYGPKPLDELIENHKKYFEAELAFEIVFHEVNTREHALVYENKVMSVFSIPLRHSLPCSGYLFVEKTPARNIHKEMIDRYAIELHEILAIKKGSDLILADGSVISNDTLTFIPYQPRSYAYCSDTASSGKVAEIVKGVDLLYHEATFGEDSKAMARNTGHSTAAQAAAVALKAEVRKLIIGHHSSRYKDATPLLDQAQQIFPNTELATEGSVFKLLL